MFKSSLLAFTVHMMLILVLGHVLALSSFAQKMINFALKYCTSTSSSVFIITFLTILVSLFNWGLGLIFGAIFTRKIGEHFQAQNKRLNYALVGASSYVGLMVWHGGLSGSATLTVAGANHSLVEQMGSIPISETIFSSMNIVVMIALLLIIPLIMSFIGKKTQNDTIPKLSNSKIFKNDESQDNKTVAEQFELNNFIGLFIGIIILLFVVYLRVSGKFSSLNLQTTNLILLGLAFVFHANIKSFLTAIEEAIGDVSGILIQFPLYFGIMGIMQESGLASLIAQSMTNTANEFTLPIFTFISAGIVNLFVPSGGGQWQIQGPIIVETAKATGTSLPKMIMALAYSDQLTNMLQPFWALPLLGITGLKAKDILPYTLILFLLGFLIFMLALIIF
jgi:short-chain fatty acids transporter